MTYKETPERINSSSSKLDGDENQGAYISKTNVEKAISLISGLTGINADKLKQFSERFGFAAIFDKPSLIGVSFEEEITLKELKELICNCIFEEGCKK